MPSINEIIYQTQELLKSTSGDQSRLEARLLIQKTLDVDLTTLISKGSDPFPTDHQDLLNNYIQRRLTHEPVSKILGEREFYGRLFAVNTDVLDPRADSEILIEESLKLLKPIQAPKIMDAGVGSGCLLLTLLAECPKAQGVALDISDNALSTTLMNAKNLRLEKHLHPLQGSILNPQETAEKLKAMDGFEDGLDLLISNPPYIPADDIKDLSPEVRSFDPILALDGGHDGLDFYRALAILAPLVLKPKAHLVLEIGQGQELEVEKICQNQGLQKIDWAQDLSGIIRCGVFTL